MIAKAAPGAGGSAPPAAERILCVQVPAFAVAVARRHHPEWQEAPLVVVHGEGSGDGGRARVEECSAQAEAAGVHPGMSRVQAEGTCPGLVPVRREELPLAQEEHHLTELLRGLSPRVEADGDGVFFLGCRGLGRLYAPAGGDPEQGLLTAAGRALGADGWTVRMALADTRFVAFAAAVCGTGREVVPAGRGRRHLAPLPLEVLPVGEELRERLQGLGIHTLGRFADLPAPTVEARYGLEGIHCHRLARGEDRGVLHLSVPDQPCERRVDVVATTVAELAAPLQAALQSLLEEMRGRKRRPASLGFTFALENGDRRLLEVSTARPTLRSGVFWDQLELALCGTPFPDRVAQVHVEVLREQQGAGQQGFLFRREGDEGKAEERWQAALGWLQGLYGEEAVVVPTLEESHRPERRGGRTVYAGAARRRPPSAAQPPAAALPLGRGPGWVRDGTSPLTPVLRLLDPPAPLEVQLERDRLQSFRWRRERHRVRSLVGPERLTGEWWDQPFDRDYYEVLTHGAGLYWLFRCRREGRWFLQGVLD